MNDVPADSPETAGVSPAEDPPPEGLPGPPAPLHILVVDDNRDAVMMLAAILSAEGHTVDVAFDGPAALEIARRRRPDAVLLDIGLPGMDGYEVARRLRAEPDTRDVRVIAVTGYGQERDRELSREAGIDEHMLKPVNFDRLFAALSGVRDPNKPQ